MDRKNYLSLESSVLFRCNQKHFDKALFEYGLGYTHLILLTEIFEKEGILMNELASIGLYDKGTITKSIQKLESGGYVKIADSKEDKRSKCLYTTRITQELMPELYRLKQEWFSLISLGIEEEDLDVYFKVLSKMVNNARENQIKETTENMISFFGLQKLTLLDYPNKMAATVFTGGCNLRCPFCHNRSLVFLNENDSEIDEEQIMDYLKKRKNILDGICITGGEPTLHKGLKAFVQKVKNLGLSVKLDTNGTNYELIKELVEEKLVDYVAMDIKNCPKKYPTTVGINDYDISVITKTKDYLLTNVVDYEFRTTVVKEFHEEEDFDELGKFIFGAKKFFIQNFEDNGTCIRNDLHSVDEEKLQKFKEKMEKYVEKVEIRGV